MGNLFIVTRDACDPYRAISCRGKLMTEYSILYAVTSIHHRGGFLLKGFKVFHSVNLTIFSKRKIFPKQTTRNSERRWNMTGDSSVKITFFGLSYTMLSISYTISVYLKNYRYGIERFRVVLERYIKDLKLELDRLIRAEFEVGLINWYGRRLRRVTFNESIPCKNMAKKK